MIVEISFQIGLVCNYLYLYLYLSVKTGTHGMGWLSQCSVYTFWNRLLKYNLEELLYFVPITFVAVLTIPVNLDSDWIVKLPHHGCMLHLIRLSSTAW